MSQDTPRPGRHTGGRASRQWLAVPVAVLFALPLLYLLSGSLRRTGLPPPRSPELLPWPLAPENYVLAAETVDLVRYGLNSLFVVAIAVPLSILVASWAAFAVARLRGRLAAVVVTASLVALMIPATALLVGRFTLFRVVGLIDTPWPLIAPALIGTTPFYVLLYYWSFRRLPTELFDAARLEGVSPFTTWRRVAMPLVGPVTVAVAVLAGVTTWSNFLDPLIYLFDERNFTLPLGLRSLAELDRTNFPLFLARAVVATVPVVVAVLLVQRRFLAAPWS